ncbi:hypothetical protein Tco_0948053, partial [Tanacetum coccineum]
NISNPFFAGDPFGGCSPDWASEPRYCLLHHPTDTYNFVYTDSETRGEFLGSRREEISEGERTSLYLCYASPLALSPGDGDDEPSDDDTDDDDADDDEEPFEDEDDDEEEEEHLAPADSSAMPFVDPVPSAGDTEAFETDDLSLAPYPRCVARDEAVTFISYTFAINFPITVQEEYRVRWGGEGGGVGYMDRVRGDVSESNAARVYFRRELRKMIEHSRRDVNDGQSCNLAFMVGMLFSIYFAASHLNGSEDVSKAANEVEVSLVSVSGMRESCGFRSVMSFMVECGGVKVRTRMLVNSVGQKGSRGNIGNCQNSTNSKWRLLKEERQDPLIEAALGPVLADSHWVDALARRELLQLCEIQKVWILVVSAFWRRHIVGTKWGLDRNKKDRVRGVVVKKSKKRQVYVDVVSLWGLKEYLVCEFVALKIDRLQMSFAMGRVSLFLVLGDYKSKQKEDGVSFISQELDSEAFSQGEESWVMVDVHLSIGSLQFPAHLKSAVKRIFRKPTQKVTILEQILIGNPQQEVVNFLAGDLFLAMQKAENCGYFY